MYNRGDDFIDVRGFLDSARLTSKITWGNAKTGSMKKKYALEAKRAVAAMETAFKTYNLALQGIARCISAEKK